MWPWFSGIGTTTIYKRGHLRALGALGALRALRALRAMGSNVINLEIAQKMAKKPAVKPISQGVYKLKIDLRVGSKPDRTWFDGLAMSFGPSQDTGVLQS